MSFVVKNGSKTLGRTPAAMPQPVSLILNATKSPESPSGLLLAWRPVFSHSIDNQPPFGIASRAFSAILTRASANSDLSTQIGQQSLGISTDSSIFPVAEPESTSWMAPTASAGCRTAGLSG